MLGGGALGERFHGSSLSCLDIGRVPSGHQGRVTGQASPDNELGLVTGQIRRALSLDFVRAQALCLLSRLCHLGEGAREVACHRQVAAREVEEARREQSAHFLAHIRGRGVRRVGEVFR